MTVLARILLLPRMLRARGIAPGLAAAPCGSIAQAKGCTLHAGVANPCVIAGRVGGGPPDATGCRAGR
jgi:hypothetical protein